MTDKLFTNIKEAPKLYVIYSGIFEQIVGVYSTRALAKQNLNLLPSEDVEEAELTIRRIVYDYALELL